MFMGHHLQMRTASPFPLTDVCKSCHEPWTLLLLCSVHGKNQWKKCHDTKPESIIPPLICHLCEVFLTPSSDSWPSQHCREVGSQAVEGLVNGQREVGPWHAGTSPGDNSSIHLSHGKKLGFHTHLHLQHNQLCFPLQGAQSISEWKQGACPCQTLLTGRAVSHRALSALFLNSLGCEITPVICRAVSLPACCWPKLSRELCCCSSAPLLGHSAPLLMIQRSLRSLVPVTSDQHFLRMF